MSRYTEMRCWQRCLVVLATVVLLLLCVMLVLFVVVLARTLATSPQDTQLEDVHTWHEDDDVQLARARRLAGAIELQTVSYELGKQNISAFTLLHEYLKRSFPLVHDSEWVHREVVNSHSLLYNVTGDDNGDRLPYLLAAHLDVVPAKTEAWEVPPFSGTIVNNSYVYGRGTIDNKSGVLALLEALELMISKGERPKRSLYLAFGHDEELGGGNGAAKIAELLAARELRGLDFVLDEGFFVTQGILFNAVDPIALVGVSEKGMLTLRLEVNGTSGHSSMPPRENAIGILALAITKLEENMFPSMLGQGVEQSTIELLAPHAPFGHRMVLSNLWLFSGLLSVIAVKDPKTNALIRTTTAVTVIRGGDKPNVVSDHAYALVNHRIHPSQSVADVITFDRHVINDPRVQIKILSAREPSPVSPFDDEASQYQLIKNSIGKTFEKTAVIPSILIANTDSKWYQPFTKNIFRFFPTTIAAHDVSRFHGNNERIGVRDFSRAVQFFVTLIRNADLE